jgi:hypothetical protein
LNVNADGDCPLTELFVHDSSLILPAFLQAPIPPANSLCLTSAIVDSLSLWNVHHNRIELLAEATERKAELAFTIDNLQALTSCREKIVVNADDTMHLISLAAHFLHEQNKKTLRNILAEPVLLSIGLGKEASK